MIHTTEIAAAPIATAPIGAVEGGKLVMC